MKSYALLADHAVDAALEHAVAQDCLSTASLLGLIAESDSRRRFLAQGYSSMHQYCVGALHMSEDVAFKRIRTARAARRYPAILEAIAARRLTISAVVLLAPYLTRENAGKLLVAAEHRTNARIELLLAEWFPRPDLPTLVMAVPTPSSPQSLAVRPVELTQAPQVGAVVITMPPAPRANLAPLSPTRFALQVTVSADTHAKLKLAEELLSHVIRPGDVASVLDRALDELLLKLKKQKHAHTNAPRPSQHVSENPRHIPSHVKREVHARDQGQCTFVGTTGHRCGERKRIELDHITPIAKGGCSTTENLRLRCRAHNQYEADRVFGEGFMRGKREYARVKQNARSHVRDLESSGAACALEPATRPEILG